MQQIRVHNQNPSFSQLSRYQPSNVALTSALYNGLWTCRHDASNLVIPVGIYHRGGGE